MLALSPGGPGGLAGRPSSTTSSGRRPTCRFWLKCGTPFGRGTQGVPRWLVGTAGRVLVGFSAPALDRDPGPGSSTKAAQVGLDLTVLEASTVEYLAVTPHPTDPTYP